MAEAYSSRRVKGRRPAASARKMGTWKLAYADFLTALCAFFLIMWLIHGVSSGEREALAQQFGSSAQSSLASLANSTSLASAEPRTDRSEEIASALRTSPLFASYTSSVTISADPGHVRIDLSDMTERPLFEVGDGALNETGHALTHLAGRAIALLPVPVLVEGHTDANPSLTAGYSNWELSSDRANSARRILIEAGVAERRIIGVSGLADTRPLLQNAPEAGVNRRISIVLVIDDKSA